MTTQLFSALALAALLSLPAHGAQTTTNLEREKNWADQIVELLMVAGEPIWLKNRNHKFLALYLPPKGGSKTGVILVHGRGVHPAWGFLDNLRSDLADAGYHTLSLQMPILAADAPFSDYAATFPEAFERVQLGIRYLREHKGVNRVVVLGHSSGAMTAVAFAASGPQEPLAGIVAIGLSTLNHGPKTMQPALMLKRVRIPVLDLYGANDLHEVVSVAPARTAAARAAGNTRYTAVRVPGADHFFTGRYDQLRSAILGWLPPPER